MTLDLTEREGSNPLFFSFKVPAEIAQFLEIRKTFGSIGVSEDFD